MNVERLKIDSLMPHPRNPRMGDTDAIVASLKTNGQYKPIVITQDNVIIAGNHTWMAAAELGWTHISAVRTEHDSDSEAALRIMLADNKTADLARYDDALVIDLLKDLSDPIGTGYTDDDLSKLLSDLEYNAGQPLTDVDLDSDLTYKCPQCDYEWNGVPRP